MLSQSMPKINPINRILYVYQIFIMRHIPAILALTFILSAMGGCKPQPPTHEELALVPQPKEVITAPGTFTLNAQTSLVITANDAEVEGVASFLSDLISPSTGFDLQRTQNFEASNVISIKIDSSITGNKGAYRLTVSDKKVEIAAPEAIGFFYGVQTLRQLLPPEIEARSLQQSVEWSIPAVVINDEPRFQYRGLHLDVGRHFFPVSFIKKYIDLLALHKMNKFHWHLTEDQGWRIEIKKYPRLQEVASQRAQTLIGHGSIKPFKYDGKPYGGYYTQEEALEIVKYAANRFITVIPEIELPGHAQAALAAYPELGCTGGPYQVAQRWGVFDDIYCAGQEKTFEFLENVLLEVMDIFPSEYIHIGGDEAPKARWEKCPRCQSRMKKEGLKDEHELQSYFIKRIEKFLSQHGRKIIGWDEILEGGLAPEATVMSWRGVKGGIAAAKMGHDVIMTPNSHAYLDYYQNDPKVEPLAIGGFLSLEKVYSYNPVPDSFSKEEAKHILGFQGNVWTEYIKTGDYAEYMTYPRACAIAEIAWSPQEKRDYKQFRSRLEQHYKRLDQLGVNYFYALPRPIVNKEQVGFLESATITLETLLPDCQIRYTTDGSNPGASSTLYTQPFEVSESMQIKAITIKEDGKSSAPLVIAAHKIEYNEPLPEVTPKKRGLNFSYYPGFFESVKVLPDQSAFSEGTVTNSFIPEVANDKAFGLVLMGFFKAEKEGLYHFHLASDDGSMLYLNNKIIVNNDGLHAEQTISGTVALRKGYYPLTIRFIEGGGGYNLGLKLEPPDGETMDLKPGDFYLTNE